MLGIYNTFHIAKHTNTQSIYSVQCSTYSNIKQQHKEYDQPVNLELAEGFPGGPAVKTPPANAGDTCCSIPGPGRFTCCAAAKPVHKNYWARALQPVLCTQRSHHSEKPALESRPPCTNKDPAQPKINYKASRVVPASTSQDNAYNHMGSWIIRPPQPWTPDWIVLPAMEKRGWARPPGHFRAGVRGLWWHRLLQGSEGSQGPLFPRNTHVTHVCVSSQWFWRRLHNS